MGRKVSILSGIALLICSSVFAAQRTDRLDLIATTTTPGRLDIYEAPSNGSSKTRIQTQAQAGDITYTLPPDDGDASYVLTTDGSGSLTWEAGGGGSGDITQVGNVLSGAAGTSSSNDVTFGNIQATRIGSVSTGDASFSALAVDTNVLYVNPSSNNVGIGTASPSAPLHVSNVNPTISIQDFDSTGDGQIGYVSFNDSANVEQGWVGFGSTGNDDLTIRNSYGGGHILVSPNGGNVGIGYTLPGQKLSVSGNLAVSGDATFASINTAKIGNTTPADATFTTIKSTGVVTLSDYIYGTSGQFSALGAFGGYGVGTATLAVQALNASTIGQNIRGAASQEANLQQWLNSTNTVLGSIGSGGDATFNSINTTKIGNLAASDATFTDVKVSSITDGECVQSSNGKLVGTGGACGSASGDITQVGNVLSGAAGTSSSNDVTFGNVQATRIGSVSAGDATFTNAQSKYFEAVSTDTSARSLVYATGKNNGAGYGMIYSKPTNTTTDNIAVNQEAITGTTGTNYAIWATADGGTAGNKAIYVPSGYPNAGANNYALHLASSAKAVITGDLGVGATAPAGKIHAHKTSGGLDVYLTNDGNTTSDYVAINFARNYASANYAAIGMYSDGSLRLDGAGSLLDNSVDMVLTDGGVVGIGTSTPSEKLTVIGDITATGDATFGSINASKIGNITAADGTFTNVRINSATPDSYSVLTVKGHASQVAYLQSWQNSAGSDLAYVNQAGQGFFPALQGTGGVGTNTGGNGFYFNSSAFMISPSAGIIKFSDNTDTSFNRLQFGGTTSSYPSIKRIGTGLFSRLADDSGMAPFSAGDSTFTSINSTKIGNVTAADASFTDVQTPQVSFGVGTLTSMSRATGQMIGFNTSGIPTVGAGMSEVRIVSGGSIGFSSHASNVTAGGQDVGIKRATAGAMQVTDGSTGIGNFSAGDVTFNSINLAKIGNTTAADGTFTTVVTTGSGLLKLSPTASAPSGPAEGWIYADSSSNELCYYTGSAWVGLVAGGSCS